MITPRYLFGTFGDEQDFLAAIKTIRAKGLTIDDAYTPYAVHGLDRALGLRPSRLTWVCFLCGAVGALSMLYFEYWTSALDWPINVGGKPFDSLPAFVPITFEAAVLLAGLGVVLALFIRCGLWPGKRPRLPVEGVTNDRFAMVIKLEDASHSAEEVRALLEPHHLEAWDERIGEEEK